MQYKIPVNVENSDKIVLGLSFVQLGFVSMGGALAYMIFQKFHGSVDTTLLIIVCAVIVGGFFLIAKFNSYEMNFLQFALNFLRLVLRQRLRGWMKGVDSISPLKIGYISSLDAKKGVSIQSKAVHERVDSIEDTVKNL